MQIGRALRSWLARSKTVTRMAIAVRDQANKVVRSRFGDAAWVADSGEKWLIRTIAPRCQVFVDVGANTGEWTALFLEAAPPGVKGVLFEPGATALSMLRRRFETSPGVNIVPIALADVEGEHTFFEEPGAGGMSSLLAGHSLHRSTERRTVAVSTLDDALDQLGLETVDFLKIDTEGFDLHVLRGARRRLQARRIKVIQFEYQHAWARSGATLGGAIRLLEGAGYTTYLLRPDGLFTFDYSLYGEHFGLSNYVAVAAEWAAEVAPHVRGPA